MADFTFVVGAEQRCLFCSEFGQRDFHQCVVHVAELLLHGKVVEGLMAEGDDFTSLLWAVALKLGFEELASRYMSDNIFGCVQT